MSTRCLKQSFRYHSGPLMFLVSTCMVLGLFFLWLDSSLGWPFFVVATTAVITFSILGARDGCSAELHPELISRRMR